ncbi:hypothetical protein SLA2020_010360 [Shorea laevis]
MRWHHEQGVDDGVMRHPADSLAWKSFDKLYGAFVVEPHNVRLGLASDGFQPFSSLRRPYSIWPVVLIRYNMEPWVCMKPSNFLLLMIIPSLEGPGDTIDVYLQPLIDELKDLGELGVTAFDASTGENFQLHAALLWTISDLPALGILSRYSTKGNLACPIWNKDTCSIRLANGGKQCFMGHWCYLPINHQRRKDKDSFDGTEEQGLPPMSYSGDDILLQVEDLEGVILTKLAKKRKKILHQNKGDNWKKRVYSSNFHIGVSF